MVRRELDANEIDGPALEASIRDIISAAPNDAVLLVRVSGSLTDAHWRAISPASTRAFVPPSMNVEIMPLEGFTRRRSPGVQSPSPEVELQPAPFD